MKIKSWKYPEKKRVSMYRGTKNEKQDKTKHVSEMLQDTKKKKKKT